MTSVGLHIKLDHDNVYNDQLVSSQNSYNKHFSYWTLTRVFEHECD